DPRAYRLGYWKAGLPAPRLQRQAGTVERLEKGGPMLGAMQDAKFNSGSVRLNPGDMLIAYSDGVTECRNSQDEEFEMERLAAAARAVSGASANRALFATLATVLDFADAGSPSDDLTLLVVRRRERIVKERRRSNGFSAPRRGAISVARPNQADGGETAPND